ncbi:MAG: CotH kinase family protein, partial [Anaerovoracaceae bacterium]
MVTNKYINAVIAALTALAVLACGIAVVFSRSYGEAEETQGLTMEYETALFGTEEPIQVNILMDEAQWQEMLDNALSEEYYSCDVVVNGETYKNVGIRPKGNTSLSSIANDPDTERYSLKLEFDHYVEGQTCCGLDKLILNNNYADATNMKEAVVYDMFQYLGADASLYNYAEISVNGNYWGVYLALEAVEDSFMLRNYGTSNGELYKPENLDGGGGQKQGMPEGGAAPENMDRQMP